MELSTFKFTFETEITFQSKCNDESISNALEIVCPGCNLSFDREECSSSEDYFVDVSNPYEGHFVVLDRWEYDNHQRPWEGRNAHYFAKLFIEQSDKMGRKEFVPYWNKNVI